VRTFLLSPAPIPRLAQLAAVLLLLSGAASAARERAVAWKHRTMGTVGTVTIVTADSSASSAAAAAAHAAFARVDSLMSNWTTTSEVARLNRDAGAAGAAGLEVERETATVLARALEVGRLTGGAMDVTVEPLVRAWGFLGGPKRVPTAAERESAFAHVGLDRLRFDPATRRLVTVDPAVRIDLGSIAKGYGVDVAAAALRAHGVRDGLVDLSGNMVALGRPPQAKQWRIGVRDPRDRVSHLARIALSDGEAIATSGKYEQFVAQDGRTYGHIMDPRTGWPAEGLISVTVVAPTAMDADAWDTGLFVLGAHDARRLAAERNDLGVVLIVPGASGRDTLWVERALQPRFQLTDAASALVELRWF
jgi:thiamine biosynthesis lipoprotein